VKGLSKSAIGNRQSAMLLAQNLELRTFLMPKSGCTLAECEDAIGINEELSRFAVADGATEAFDAKSWSNRLVTSWVNTEVDNFEKWLEEQGRLQHESWNGLKLSWYAEEKSALGSFAAFVGAQCDIVDERLRLRSVALGDSCLIHQRGDEILLSLPLFDANDFTSTPMLAPSSSALLEKVLPDVVTKEFWLECGDTIWLLSDAVSAWFLGKSKKFSEFVSLIDDSSDELLIKFFERERQRNRIKDDDVAIVRICITVNG
jgi:hypothetical protein